MDTLQAHLGALVGGNSLPSLLMFLAVATLTLAVGIAMQSRRAIRRRVASITRDAAQPMRDPHSPRNAGRRAAERLGSYADRHFASLDGDAQRLLRSRLVQAGFLSPRAPTLFMLSRLVGLVAFSVSAHFTVPQAMPGLSVGMQWLAVGGLALVGYYVPQIYINRRTKQRQIEHRVGFPDFMDLMVVCSDAGLSMEAALDRVGRELAASHPSLSSNVYMAILELRAGRPLGEALERLGDRLAIDEARSFATLLQQSEELGTSLTETLRVYSDDMRHQRLARAEEKAYSLPAKLSVPLTLCIFPVVMVVTMLPVVIRMRDAGF